MSVRMLTFTGRLYSRTPSSNILILRDGRHPCPRHGRVPHRVDCQVHGGYLWGLPVSAIGLTNCLLDRVATSVDAGNTPTVTFRNNLLRGGYFEIFDYSPDVTMRDNFFDRTAIPYWNDVVSSHNGYVSGADRLQPTQATDKILAPVYVTGPLGDYYQPANSILLNAGSQSAAASGLYHYTTTTNQAKEAGSTVDIGLHWIALDAQNQPMDTDRDQLADYFEDQNGDGVFNGSDLAD